MKAIIITYAYNAEKTIRRTIDSILLQSHTDFVYYIIDNASTDNTNQIISEYEKIDSRIVKITKTQNDIWVSFKVMPEILQKYSREDFLCYIDADDEYKADFLEKMIWFMEENLLDIAACGSDFIYAKTMNIVGQRIAEHNIFLEGDDFDKYFTVYNPYIRTMWAKLYRVSVLLEGTFTPCYEMSYGGDTVFVLEAFQHTNRVGIMAQTLHKYYLSKKSASYSFNEKRIASDKLLFDALYSFLCVKCGVVSTQTEDMLYIMHFNGIKDTVEVLLKSSMNFDEKLKFLYEVFQGPQIQALIKRNMLNKEKNYLCNGILQWLFEQKKGQYNSSELDIITDILIIMNVYSLQIDGWQDCWFFLLLSKLTEKLSSKEFISKDIDEIIRSISKQYPLISSFEGSFLAYFSDVIFCVLQNDQAEALQKIKSRLEKDLYIPTKYIDNLLLLGINIAATINYEADFVLFKKLRIEMYINTFQYKEARNELDDWDRILPDDQDFKEYRSIIQS